MQKSCKLTPVYTPARGRGLFGLLQEPLLIKLTGWGLRTTAKGHDMVMPLFLNSQPAPESLLLPVGLHKRPDPKPERVDLDEAFGICLVEDLVLLEGGEVQVEERIGL